MGYAVLMSAPCPVCGYDLSGIPSSWTDRCPVEGVCSECGEAVRWGEVLVPRPVELPWFVEQSGGRGGRGLWRRAVGTWIAAMAPWWFWSRAGAVDSVSWVRAALWLPIVLGMLHVIKSVMASGARGIAYWAYSSDLNFWAVWASDDWTQPFLLIYYNANPFQVLGHQWQFIFWPVQAWAMVGAQGGAAAVVLALAPFLARDRRRRALRALVYSLAWVPLFWVMGVADAAVRLIGAALSLLGGGDPMEWEHEQLYDVLWEVWPLWSVPIAAWWVAWWWCALGRGPSGESSRDIAIITLAASLWTGVVAAAFAQML